MRRQPASHTTELYFPRAFDSLAQALARARRTAAPPTSPPAAFADGGELVVVKNVTDNGSSNRYCPVPFGAPKLFVEEKCELNLLYNVRDLTKQIFP